jgi:hypothetical protein
VASPKVWADVWLLAFAEAALGGRGAGRVLLEPGVALVPIEKDPVWKRLNSLVSSRPKIVDNRVSSRFSGIFIRR